MDHSLSNYQIDSYYTGEPLYGGCCSKDQLKGVEPSGKFWVINLQSSTAGNGTHWVFVSDMNPVFCFYVDSYGVSPPPEIVAFMKKSASGRMKYSHDELQEMTSSECGYFCLYCIDRLLKHQSYENGLEKHPGQHNEVAVLRNADGRI